MAREPSAVLLVLPRGLTSRGVLRVAAAACLELAVVGSGHTTTVPVAELNTSGHRFNNGVKGVVVGAPPSASGVVGIASEVLVCFLGPVTVGTRDIDVVQVEGVVDAARAVLNVRIFTADAGEGSE